MMMIEVSSEQSKSKFIYIHSAAGAAAAALCVVTTWYFFSVFVT